jgi:hypothetical protein
MPLYINTKLILQAIDKYVQKNVVEPKVKAEEKKAEEDEAAAKAELDRVLAEQDVLQKQVSSEMEAGQQQIAKTKQESEVIQRESGERRLSSVRARVRSLSRPMLSKGVSL